MKRIELYTLIKTMDLSKKCIELFGQNMTRCKNEQLIQLINDNKESKQSTTSEKTENPSTNTSDKDIAFLNEYFGINLPSLDKVDWKYVSKCGYIDEVFIEKFSQYLDWETMTKYQKLTPVIIKKYCCDNDIYILNIVDNDNVILNISLIIRLFNELELHKGLFLSKLLERQVMSESEIKMFMPEILAYSNEIHPKVWDRCFSFDFLYEHFIDISKRYNMTYIFRKNTIPVNILQQWITTNLCQYDELKEVIYTQKLPLWFLNKYFTYFNIIDIVKYQDNAQVFFDSNRVILVNSYKHLLPELTQYIYISPELLKHLIQL